MRLLRTAARATVATRVIGSTHRRQQQRWAAEDAAAAPAPVEETLAPAVASTGTTTTLEQLTQLGQLRDSGVLTAEESETQKQRILASM
ncbi:MAG: hypothetical protein ABI310_07905 [Microbacteriaceae bacterium]